MQNFTWVAIASHRVGFEVSLCHLQCSLPLLYVYYGGKGKLLSLSSPGYLAKGVRRVNSKYRINGGSLQIEGFYSAFLKCCF